MEIDVKEYSNVFALREDLKLGNFKDSLEGSRVSNAPDSHCERGQRLDIRFKISIGCKVPIGFSNSIGDS